METALPDSTSRCGFIDIARGFCMLYVIAVHTIAGVFPGKEFCDWTRPFTMLAFKNPAQTPVINFGIVLVASVILALAGDFFIRRQEIREWLGLAKRTI